MNKPVDHLPEIHERVQKVIHEYTSKILTSCPAIRRIYLTGSVPLQDYYSSKSDIDFITLMSEIPEDSVLQQFEAIHHHIERRFNHPKLNGYYISIPEIEKGKTHFPSFYKNKFYTSRLLDLIQVTLLEIKTSSISIYGIPAKDLFPEMRLEQVYDELYKNINSYWSGWITDHSPMKPGFILLAFFPRLTEWGVLGVARQLYTLETGKIASKKDAGEYCLEKLPESLKPVMQQAIVTRMKNKTEFRPSFLRAKMSLACMKFLIEEFNRRMAAQG